jgi:hypothetical protein
MKQFTLIALLTVSAIVYSCNSNNRADADKKVTDTTSNNEKKPDTEKEVVMDKDPRKIGPEKPESQLQIENNIYKINASENPLYGYWVGAFGKNKINIALANRTNDSIFGHSVCAGNFRPIKGTIKESEPEVYTISMNEPGDDQYDGTFNFTIDVRKSELTGNWKPYKNTAGAKDYKLQKKEFKYDPSIGDFPEASTRYLEVPDVENILPEEIEIIRNEIYARHGYSFTNIKIRRIFDAKDWYIPMGVDIRDQLTELEAHNIDLLYNYEKYYEEYYNDFGR